MDVRTQFVTAGAMYAHTHHLVDCLTTTFQYHLGHHNLLSIYVPEAYVVRTENVDFTMYVLVGREGPL